MAAVDPKGGEKYWVDGMPFQGIKDSPYNTGTEKYWLDGQPVKWLFPNGAQKFAMFLVFE